MATESAWWPRSGHARLGIALAPDGSLFVGGSGTSGGGGGHVKRYRPDGTFVRVAGQANALGGSGDGGPALEAGLQLPDRLRASRSGDLY